MEFEIIKMQTNMGKEFIIVEGLTQLSIDISKRTSEIPPNLCIFKSAFHPPTSYGFFCRAMELWIRHNINLRILEVIISNCWYNNLKEKILLIKTRLRDGFLFYWMIIFELSLIFCFLNMKYFIDFDTNNSCVLVLVFS